MNAKEFISDIRDVFKSRVFVALILALFLETVIFIILVLVNIHAGTTIQARCDIGGGRPVCASSSVSWTYLFNFAAFAVVAFFGNVLASLKLLGAKGRATAISYLWISVIATLIASVIILAIFHTLEA